MTDLIGELTGVVGDQHVVVEPTAQQRFLRDFSWYSPVLADAFIDTRIDAVVQPATLTELEQSIVEFKRSTDPFGLLNPGKLDGTFYTGASRR